MNEEEHEWVKSDGDNLRRFYFYNETGKPVLLDLPVVEELLKQAGWRKITTQLAAARKAQLQQQTA